MILQFEFYVVLLQPVMKRRPLAVWHAALVTNYEDDMRPRSIRWLPRFSSPTITNIYVKRTKRNYRYSNSSVIKHLVCGLHQRSEFYV